MEVVDTSNGFLFRKIDQADLNFDWVEFMDIGAHWMRTTVPYGPGAGPGRQRWRPVALAVITGPSETTAGSDGPAQA